MTNAAAAPRHEATWLGHPRGLLFLSFTEACERFSYYGMVALLVLYMVQQLLLPGHVEHVAGIQALRHALESMTGPMSTQAFAAQIFGLYTGLVYLTPVFGGILSDRWLGARVTVLIGIGLMAAGHFLMAFDWSALLALSLLVLGSGCLKGNIATQVGHLYPRREEDRRARGYTIFSTGINIGATLGPLSCGLVAEVWGWHFGFALAGVLMLVAAAVYLMGLKHFATEQHRSTRREARAPLTGPEWKLIAMVLLVIGFGLPQTFAYDLQFNSGFIFLADRVALDTPFGHVPEAWFVSEDSFASIIIVPVLIVLWRWQARRGKSWSDLAKIAFGGVLQGVAVLSLMAGDYFAGEAKVPLTFAIIAFAFSGFGFMYQWPTTLSLVSRLSPGKTVSLLMALAYCGAFVSGVFTGWLARFYETMAPWQFWLGSAVMTFAGSVVIWLCQRPLDKASERLGSAVAA